MLGKLPWIDIIGFLSSSPRDVATVAQVNRFFAAIILQCSITSSCSAIDCLKAVAVFVVLVPIVLAFRIAANAAVPSDIRSAIFLRIVCEDVLLQFL